MFDLLRSVHSEGQGLTNRGGFKDIFHSSSTEVEVSKTESPSKASLPEERRSSQAQPYQTNTHCCNPPVERTVNSNAIY